MFRGCGHSFHVECLLPDVSICKICQTTLLSKIEVLGKTANDAVLNGGSQTNEDVDEDTSDDDMQWIRRRNRMLRERTTTTTAKCGHSVAKNKFVAKTRGSTTIVCPFCFQFSPVKYLLRSPLILLQPFNSLVNTKRTTFIGLRQWQLATQTGYDIFAKRFHDDRY